MQTDARKHNTQIADRIAGISSPRPTINSSTMGVLSSCGVVAWIYWMNSVLRNPTGVGPPAEAPATLGLVARITYYATHRRCWDYFYLFVSGHLITKGLELLEESRRPSFTWIGGLASIAFMWLLATGATRYEASHFRNRPWPPMSWSEMFTLDVTAPDG